LGADLGWSLGTNLLSVTASDFISGYRTGKTQHNLLLGAEMSFRL
jgi:hypothetical protein